MTQINKIRNKRSNNQYPRDIKNYKRILWTVICEQIGQHNKFLETYNLPGLNREELNNLNIAIISGEIEFVMIEI